MKYVSLLLMLLFAAGYLYADEGKPTVYTARAVKTTGPSGSTSVKIYVKSFTTDQEVIQLANLLKTDGPDAVLKAMHKMERGRLAPVRKTGTNVGVVRMKPTEKGMRITMLMDRPIAFAELWRGSRSTDYPFGILQMELDKDGKGEGILIVAAKIQFTADNTIEVENYGIAPIKLMNISKLN